MKLRVLLCSVMLLTHNMVFARKLGLGLSKINFARTGIDGELLSYNISCNPPIELANYRHNIGKNFRSHDIDVTLHRNIQRFSSGIVSIKKCGDVASYNTCQHFITFRFGDEICDIAQDEHAFWTPAMRSITPYPRCPLKAGLYKIRNASVDMELLQKFYIPPHDTVWEASGSITDENKKVIGCGEGRGRVLFYRK